MRLLLIVVQVLFLLRRRWRVACLVHFFLCVVGTLVVVVSSSVAQPTKRSGGLRLDTRSVICDMTLGHIFRFLGPFYSHKRFFDSNLCRKPSHISGRSGTENGQRIYWCVYFFILFLLLFLCQRFVVVVVVVVVVEFHPPHAWNIQFRCCCCRCHWSTCCCRINVNCNSVDEVLSFVF